MTACNSVTLPPEEFIDNVKIEYYKPENPNGAAVVICPGGGYGCLCSSYEGVDIAKWLNQYGIAGIVVYYSVAEHGLHPRPLQQASLAMRIVRMNAAEHGIDPGRIGIMGFSAGGHLASSLATHYRAGDPAQTQKANHYSSRPDFQILIYPVITMGGKTHAGSRNNLLGDLADDPEMRHYYSNELQVKPDNPPAFVCHAVTDSVVPVDNSRMYVEALRKNGVPVEYVELPRGEHGLGSGTGEDWKAWQDACLEWLKINGLATTGK